MACHCSNSKALGGSCAAYDISPESEPALELHSRAAPSVEAHHHVNGPDTGRNLGGRRIIKKGLLAKWGIWGIGIITCSTFPFLKVT